ncbi:neuronal tyrosine-phosphorylated phosphoinositide-3-kinase adapter 1-like [Sinocyclocheilus grahami]|uniref:neuronal tyrosine-phosphorylated phosphoinositide-3-kinase adapter 1-like n=1 Tax=Sinocyclocheilus grahami TaxID=75366 RepID=UPI0007ACFE0E|nr:PREDICTED: neuronal tyrosine-phosphorylated phosphoinositide-3-kinase adapter 1-like [Sinocyclocheilus grahami]
MLGETKAGCKLGRSASTSGVPSPVGTPQRHAPDASAHPCGTLFQMPPMPWACGDSTMMEMIEKKRHLCKEIKARQRPSDKALCKQDSMPILPSLCIKATSIALPRNQRVMLVHSSTLHFM